jgi:hypothetical protein
MEEPPAALDHAGRLGDRVSGQLSRHYAAKLYSTDRSTTDPPERPSGARVGLPSSFFCPGRPVRQSRRAGRAAAGAPVRAGGAPLRRVGPTRVRIGTAPTLGRKQLRAGRHAGGS